MRNDPRRRGPTAKPEPANAFDRLRRHFVDLGGAELELPLRLPGREPTTFPGLAGGLGDRSLVERDRA